jgi:hypothetical protein
MNNDESRSCLVFLKIGGFYPTHAVPTPPPTGSHKSREGLHGTGGEMPRGLGKPHVEDSVIPVRE